MSSDTPIHLCNHHHNRDVEHFHYSQRFLVHLFRVSPLPSIARSLISLL